MDGAEALLKHEWRGHQPDRSWQVELLRLLTTHAERESAALASYRKLVEQSDNPGIRYLAKLILEDEERHHRMLNEMANTLRSEIEELDLRPRTPWLPSGTDRAWHELTNQLLAVEQDDAHELHRLRKRLRGSPRSSLLPLVASMLAHDTEKHIEILHFIRDHTSPHRRPLVVT